MEEDIKILEELIKLYYSHTIVEDYDVMIDIGFKREQTRALETLIKGYRELEAKLNQLLKYEDDLRIKERAFCKENHIPKSKIKEKIEEYQTNMKKYEYADKNIFNENNIRQEVITVLQELMEDK